jgi:acyl-CoA synthetase (NDP forming)
MTRVESVNGPDAALEAAERLGASLVVLKIDAVDLPHKSDLGLVRIGVRPGAELRAAAEDLLRTAERHGVQPRGLLVEPMAAPGLELIVGLRRDASFGPCVVVGLGGVLTEVLDDVAIRLAPIRPDVAAEMLAELRGARLLDGARGRPAVDRAAVVQLIVALSSLAMERPDLVEVDLNPVIVSPEGAVAVDALVVVDRG